MMKYRVSFISFLIIAFTILTVVIRNPQYILTYDNFGSYMILPNTFIYHDLTLKDFSTINSINEKYKLTPTLYQFDRLENGNHIIRFFTGMALMVMPFFFIGHFIALVFQFPSDGYSDPYVWAIVSAGIFYGLLGFYFLRKILLKYFSDGITALSLIIFYFGTNIFFFTSMGNPFPHIPVFALYALLMYFTILWHEDQKPIFAGIIGLILGLLLVTRPSEIIALIIPLFWGVYNKSTLLSKARLLFQYRKQLIYVLMFAFLAGIPQLVYWKTVAHSLFYFPYNDPQSGMDFLAPRFWWVLFSYRKGWLVYSPVMILSLTGLILLFKKHKQIFLAIFIFFLLNLYLIASFSSLVSYGFRAFIQSYAVMIIPFGFTIEYLFTRKIWVRVFVSVILAGFFYINIFQAWQIRVGILHGSRTTGEYYRAVFLEKNVTPEDRELLLIERSADGIDRFKNEESYNRKVVCEESFENPIKNKEKYFVKELSNTGKYCMKMEESNIYSPGCNVKFKEITGEYYAWLRVSLKVFPVHPIDQCEVRLVAAFTHKGKTYKYRAVSLPESNPDFKMNEWNIISFDYLTPEVRSKNDELTVYAWFRGKKEIYIDDLKVESFTLD